MLRNYLKIGLRNVIRYKGYSLLNISSLAIGITCFLFVTLFVLHEFSYDKYHLNKDNIYRIVTDSYIGTPAPLLPECIKKIPEIVSGARVRWATKNSNEIFKYGKKMFNESGFFLADPAFFDIFSFEFIKGNPKTALIDPKSIVITESTAKKYFDKEDPVGKILSSINYKDLVVTGVVKDVPENSHFHFDMVGQFPQNLNAGWGMYNFLTYILVRENASPDLVLKKIGEIATETAKKNKNPFLLQKITDIHLNSHIRGEIEQNGYMSNIYIYSAIAFIVLIIACINYTNLIMAQYSKRENEIGVRKVIGAEKKNIIAQFMIETMLCLAAAIVCALLLFEILSPYINNILGKQLSLGQLGSLNIILGLSVLVIVLLLLSGGYPALYLSSFNPANIMKGGSGKIFKGSALKNTLLILQFSFSIFFLIATLLISSQMKFLTTTRLGFNKEHILDIKLTDGPDSRNEVFANELNKIPGVKSASFNNFLLSGNNYNQNVWWEGLKEDDWDHGMRWIVVDSNFIKTFQLKSIQGNDFSANESEVGYIINESALKYTGWKNAVGKKFDIIGKGNVLGVVEDYHTKSLHESIVPCALVVLPLQKGSYNYLSVRLSQGDIPGIRSRIKNLWERIIPDKPFYSFFFDEDYNALYDEEQRTGQIFTYAAAMAIIISFLGLFGLVALTGQQKTKEIAMRKVLGASVTNIILLLSKDFAGLVIIANILAWPAAYYFANKWLQNFAYKVDINLSAFIFTGLGAFILALMIVGFRAFKASLANPVDSLKSE